VRPGGSKEDACKFEAESKQKQDPSAVHFKKFILKYEFWVPAGANPYDYMPEEYRHKLQPRKGKHTEL
jgi:hypothetical protein